MNSSSLPKTLRAALILTLTFAMSACTTLVVGAASTAAAIGGAAVSVGVGVGKTVVKTGAGVAVDLAIPD